MLLKNNYSKMWTVTHKASSAGDTPSGCSALLKTAVHHEIEKQAQLARLSGDKHIMQDKLKKPLPETKNIDFTMA